MLSFTLPITGQPPGQTGWIKMTGVLIDGPGWEGCEYVSQMTVYDDNEALS